MPPLVLAATAAYAASSPRASVIHEKHASRPSVPSSGSGSARPSRERKWKSCSTSSSAGTSCLPAPSAPSAPSALGEARCASSGSSADGTARSGGAASPLLGREGSIAPGKPRSPRCAAASATVMLCSRVSGGGRCESARHSRSTSPRRLRMPSATFITAAPSPPAAASGEAGSAAVSESSRPSQSACASVGMRSAGTSAMCSGVPRALSWGIVIRASCFARAAALSGRAAARKHAAGSTERRSAHPPDRRTVVARGGGGGRRCQDSLPRCDARGVGGAVLHGVAPTIARRVNQLGVGHVLNGVDPAIARRVHELGVRHAVADQVQDHPTRQVDERHEAVAAHDLPVLVAQLVLGLAQPAVQRRDLEPRRLLEPRLVAGALHRGEHAADERGVDLLGAARVAARRDAELRLGVEPLDQQRRPERARVLVERHEAHAEDRLGRRLADVDRLQLHAAHDEREHEGLEVPEAHLVRGRVGVGVGVG
eukprot:scaffold89060_cov57-Phaeocystis_antarctica.AAC.2